MLWTSTSQKEVLLLAFNFFKWSFDDKAEQSELKAKITDMKKWEGWSVLKANKIYQIETQKGFYQWQACRKERKRLTEIVFHYLCIELAVPRRLYYEWIN